MLEPEPALKPAAQQAEWRVGRQAYGQGRRRPRLPGNLLAEREMGAEDGEDTGCRWQTADGRQGGISAGLDQSQPF